jgi:hypothetical protein
LKLKKVLHLLTDLDPKKGTCEKCGKGVMDCDVYSTCNPDTYTNPPIRFIPCNMMETYEELIQS